MSRDKILFSAEKIIKKLNSYNFYFLSNLYSVETNPNSGSTNFATNKCFFIAIYDFLSSNKMTFLSEDEFVKQYSKNFHYDEMMNKFQYADDTQKSIWNANFKDTTNNMITQINGKQQSAINNLINDFNIKINVHFGYEFVGEWYARLQPDIPIGDGKYIISILNIPGHFEYITKFGNKLDVDALREECNVVISLPKEERILLKNKRNFENMESLRKAQRKYDELQKLRIPYKNSSIPHKNSSIPHKNSSIPHKNSSIPHKNSSVSYKNSSVSHKNSSIPYKNSSIPYKNSSIPHKNSSVPVIPSDLLKNSMASFHKEVIQKRIIQEEKKIEEENRKINEKIARELQVQIRQKYMDEEYAHRIEKEEENRKINEKIDRELQVQIRQKYMDEEYARRIEKEEEKRKIDEKKKKVKQQYDSDENLAKILQEQNRQELRDEECAREIEKEELRMFNLNYRNTDF